MASSFFATLEKTLQCPVCKKLFVDPHVPKELPHCSHVCCQPCLETLAKQSTIDDVYELRCPECRTVAYIPKGSVSELKTNLQVWNLAEAHRSHKKQMKKQALVEDATNKMSEFSIQTEPPSSPGYVEMRPSIKHQSVTVQQTDKVENQLPPIQHTYMETLQKSPNKPYERPLPEVPGANTTHPSNPSRQFTHHRNPPPDNSQQSATVEQTNRGQRESFDEELPVCAFGFGTFEQVQAIACTPDGLMVACDFRGENVKVFEKQRGRYRQKLQLELNEKNPRKPTDVAVVTKTEKAGSLTRIFKEYPAASYMYLVARNVGVEVYTPKGKYERTIKPCESDGICSVTTTVDGRILIGDIKRFVITEHDTDGIVLRTVRVKTKPVRIEALNGSLVAISHFRSGKIEIIDMATETSTLTIDVPEALGMCYLKKSDTILVARSETSKSPGTIKYDTGTVQQYCCKTGQFKSHVIQGMYHPIDLTTTDDGLLAVADEKKIMMYKGNTQSVTLYETYQ